MLRPKLALLLALFAIAALPVALAHAQKAEPPPRNMAVIWDNLSLSDSITYTLTGMPKLGPDKALEGWLISDDNSVRLSTGIMTVAEDGSVNHSTTTPSGENLIRRYDKVVITVEPVPDPSPAKPSDEVLWSHRIPSRAMEHIRHLLTNWPEPATKGVITNLKEQLEAALLHAQLAQAATTIAEFQTHAHHVINIIEGPTGSNFDADFGNPGDGIGVLTHAADRKHAGFAADMAPDDADITNHAALVETNGKNVEDWAKQARDQSLVALGVSGLTQAQIQMIPVIGLLNSAVNGTDAGGSGTIDSISGEGGAKQAYVEAQLMATYALSPGGLPKPIQLGPGLPSAGDSAVPMVAWLALAFGVALAAGGAALFWRHHRA
ncbi:MAG: anti-sigma factor [SAR202 cluster bacterium]|nr:anti-sigma factor [SAR202 cluster bacterium]